METVPSPSPLVSVIIPTRNSESVVERCIDSMRRQDYPEIQVIVVDNHSEDRTQEIARARADLYLEFGPERSAQRNEGVRHAKGGYVLIIDSDMELSPGVIGACVRLFKSNSQIKAAVIPEESFGEGFWAQCKKLERAFYMGVEWMEGARFFSKDTFMEFGGYDETNTGTEDFDLPQRIRAKYGTHSIGRITALIYHNEQRLSLIKTCKKKFYYAQRLSSYRARQENRASFAKQASIARRYMLFLGRPGLLLAHPLLGSGMLFMKTCEFLAGACGYMLFSLRRHAPSGAVTSR